MLQCHIAKKRQSGPSSLEIVLISHNKQHLLASGWCRAPKDSQERMRVPRRATKVLGEKDMGHCKDVLKEQGK